MFRTYMSKCIVLRFYHFLKSWRIMISAKTNRTNSFLKTGISAIGFGGNHYSPRFQKMIETQNYAFGHICPKHKLDSLDDNMILEMINKTVPKPEQAVLDWKGMNSSQRKNIIDLLERNGINWVRV